MNIAGIVAEFNPFHNGHAHLINTAKQMGAACIVCSLSGNFVQRGEPAIISKKARAEAALRCGVDLCLELPVVYSMSTAQNFAFGSVYALVAAGVDTIVFGSECGDVQALKKIADSIESDAFKAALEKALSSGCSFPAARQAAVGALLGEGTAKILENPNDNLGIEYILAAKRIGAELDFAAVKRVGAPHDGNEPIDQYPSASFIRSAVKNGRLDKMADYMPADAFEILNKEAANGRISDISRLETAILARLRSMNEAEFRALPDISEGIENRLINAVSDSSSLNELFEKVKTKRYSHARIRRLALSAFLLIDNEFFLSPPPYVRILGHTAAGRAQLKHAFEGTPAYSRFSEINDCGSSSAIRMFEKECVAADLFELSLEKPGKCGSEFRGKIITF